MTTDTEIIEATSTELAVKVEPLALIQGTPTEVIERATEMADRLRDVIRSRHLYADIQGKQHVTVEGWTTLGALVGVFPVVEWSREMDGGWEARVEVRTVSGQTIGAAEAQCTRSERSWQSRDDYALRSMAQTRATSKAMRLPLAWIMSLAGFEPTPADEMPRDFEEGGSVTDAPLPRPDAAQGGAWGDPMPAGAPRSAENLMNLKYAGNCTDCGYKIAVGTSALYNGTSKTVRHAEGECPEPDGFTHTDEM